MVGRENVYLMTFEENRFVVDLLDVVPPDNVIVVRTTGPVRTIVDVLRGLGRARREGMDAAVDFEFFARSSAILCFLCGASRRVGFHPVAGEASYRGDLMTHRLVYNPRLHVSELFMSIIDALTLDPRALPALDLPPASPAPPPLVEIGDDERRSVELVVASQLRPGSIGAPALPPLVLLNANAGDLLPLRRWPTERYVELARRLLEADDELAVAFTGSPSEAADSRTPRRPRWGRTGASAWGAERLSASSSFCTRCRRCW